MTSALKFLQDHNIKGSIKFKDIYLSEKGDFKLCALDYHEF